MKTNNLKRIIIFCFCFCLSFFCVIIANAASYNTYSPYFGFCSFGDFDEVNGTGGCMLLEWNSVGLTEFDSSTDTYEQELLFYDYDDNAYATSNRIYHTDLPNPYFDTAFADRPGEVNIAVGTYAPEDIEANTYYSVILGLDVENSAGSKYKISAQEGRHYIIENKYTVYSESTFAIAPFKNGHIAPDHSCFWWNETPSANNTMATAEARLQNTWINGTISSSSDIDYYKIRLTGTTNVYFRSPSEDYDYDVRIYNAQGDLISSLVASTLEQTRTISITENGYYYFKVYPFSSDVSDLAYRLYVD
ncbi:MAG: hypothetical protein IKJ88_08305 [Clostridia bacterium]|nr:hypothetical protein [Clostridia bacterium]MBR3975846.1 hypothetical protein [Clostridia bacterium]